MISQLTTYQPKQSNEPMKLQLDNATLIKRYKRFLADVILADGSTTTLHVANTGAMTGCADEGDIVWYSSSNNPKRKYPFSWEITEKPNGDLICVNTIRANHLVEQAIIEGTISEFANYQSLQREVRYGNENSKIDFLLTDQQSNNVYVEVKSVTLLTEKQGYFPDAVTIRGQKHIRELIDMVEQGHRAVLLFAVLHSGIDSVQAAKHIDPSYALLLAKAQQLGVEIIAYQATFDMNDNEMTLKLAKSLDVIIN